MNNFTKILLLGGVAFAFFALRKKAAVGTLRFVLRGVGADFSSILSPKLKLTLGVQNPSNSSFNIKSIVGDLSVNGNYLANVNTFSNVDVKSNAETLLPITVELSIANVVSDVLQLIRLKGKKELNISLVGTVNADGIAFPLNTSFKWL